MKRFLPLVGIALVACLPTAACAADAAKPAKPEAFNLNDNDRVVLLGNTLIEREQRYGYWEAALTARFPDKNIQFRNLGWAGDTVWGQARAGFGTQADGFKHLKEHVASIEPTVVIVGYGNNEAFDGAAGLTHFLDGLNKLLDTLAETKARIVLLSPTRQEDLGRPLPDPTAPNKNGQLYRDAMRKVAEKRGYAFVDLFDLLPDGGKAKSPLLLTDNGIHFTAYGYWRSSFALTRGLGLNAKPWQVQIDLEKKVAQVEGGKFTPEKANADGARFAENAVSFQIADAALPLPLFEKEVEHPETMPEAERLLRVRGLAPGKYVLTIDGKATVTTTAKAWADGVKLQCGPEFDQAEKLRAAIVEKNRLYFHRWRPQNETYLFGFRKHEQGQNAREIPQFDPLVAKQEEEIAKLRVPVAHTYELKARTTGGDK